MRNILLGLIIAFLLIACSRGGEVEVKFNISNPKADEIKLLVLDQEYDIEIDEAGRAVKTIAVPHSTYGHFIYLNTTYTVYFTPKKNIDISLDADDRSGRIFIYCDDDGINSYLARERYITYGLNESTYRLDEKSYLKKLDNRIFRKREYMKSKELPADFTALESERIAYKEMENIFFYPVYRRYFTKNKDYRGSEKFEDYIDSMFVQRPELLALRSYKSFLIRYVEKKSIEKTEDSNIPRISRQVAYVVENVDSPGISDFLLNAFIYSYIERNGIEGNDSIIDAYKDNVTGSNYKAKFQQLISRFESLKKGQPSPGFSFVDIKGNTVSLKDLKGKHVYIDVWASWCSPSSKEQIYFQRLINEYKGKNIAFVCISLDDNFNRWKDAVEKRKLEGIQLFAGEKEKFSSDYFINTIPRFILIDKDGKMVDYMAKRPSSNNIRKELNSLAGL